MSAFQERRQFLAKAGVFISTLFLGACSPRKGVMIIPTAELFPTGGIRVEPHDAYHSENFHFKNGMDYPVMIHFDILAEVIRRYGLEQGISYGNAVSIFLADEILDGEIDNVVIQPSALNRAGAWILGGNMVESLGHRPLDDGDWTYLSTGLSIAVIDALAQLAEVHGEIAPGTDREITRQYQAQLTGLSDYFVAEVQPG